MVESLKMAQIRNNTVVIYQPVRHRKLVSAELLALKRERKDKMLALRKEAYSGLVKNGTKKRLAKAVNLLVASSVQREVFCKQLNKKIKHKISFITLTVPTNEAKEAKFLNKNLLEPMLKYLRQVHKMNSYVWKVEYQKRGQLHYHITSDVYVYHPELRNKWNKLLAKHGLMNEYIALKGNTNANSTDIHSVKKVKDLASYLVKYMVKSYQNEKSVKGKIWDCSLNLKKANYYTTDFTGDIENDFLELEEKKVVECYRSERFAIIKFKGVSPIVFFPKEVKEAYYRNLIEIRMYKRDLFNCTKKENKKVDGVLIPIQNKIVPKYHQYYMFN